DFHVTGVQTCALPILRIEGKALCIGVGVATPEEIDRLNILWASMRAMRRAVESLKVRPQHVLIDGNRCFPDSPWSHTLIIDGDEIGRASCRERTGRTW